MDRCPAMSANSVFSLILLFAMGRCRSITAEGSLPAAEVSAAEGQPVVGSQSPEAPALRISSWSNGVPEFSVDPPAKLLSISFYRQDSSEPIWIVVSDRFSPAQGEIVGGNVARGLGNQDGSVDRVADLAREAGVLTAKFTYGVIPSGFQQLVPSTGLPQRLKVGQRYVLTTNGEGLVRSARIMFGGEGR